MERINKVKSQFSEKNNEIEKPVAGFIKKKRFVNKYEKGAMTIDNSRD